ncbi:hypothetical protein BB561_002052 [Smittium simulii]|uniref:Protein kinase domain-containing protein n=1 Tax=Smittium simulii TaxID=133385 RepID=A0A2T9YRZ0_9FUNG|nr:hypothetical protein BB561_002052 [Smittium simulii]
MILRKRKLNDGTEKNQDFFHQANQKNSDITAFNLLNHRFKPESAYLQDSPIYSDSLCSKESHYNQPYLSKSSRLSSFLSKSTLDSFALNTINYIQTKKNTCLVDNAFVSKESTPKNQKINDFSHLNLKLPDIHTSFTAKKIKLLYNSKLPNHSSKNNAKNSKCFNKIIQTFNQNLKSKHGLHSINVAQNDTKLHKGLLSSNTAFIKIKSKEGLHFINNASANTISQNRLHSINNAENITKSHKRLLSSNTAENIIKSHKRLLSINTAENITKSHKRLLSGNTAFIKIKSKESLNFIKNVPINTISQNSLHSINNSLNNINSNHLQNLSFSFNVCPNFEFNSSSGAFFGIENSSQLHKYSLNYIPKDIYSSNAIPSNVKKNYLINKFTTDSNIISLFANKFKTTKSNSLSLKNLANIKPDPIYNYYYKKMDNFIQNFQNANNFNKQSDVFTAEPTDDSFLDYASCNSDDHDGHFIVNIGDNITSRFVVIKLLGQGTFGKAIECFDYHLQKKVAIKIVRALPVYREAAISELKTIRILQDADIMNNYRCVQPFDAFEFNNHICLVFELYGLSLYDFLKSNNFSPYPIKHIQSIIFQLLYGIAFAHSMKLVHTDLKPENILLTNSDYTYDYLDGKRDKMCKILKSPEIKIIDFGSAVFEEDEHPPVISTRHYRAPEVILGQKWSYPADMWSIGCILIELLTGCTLFRTSDDAEHLAMIQKVFGVIPSSLISRCSLKTYRHFFRSDKLKYFTKTNPNTAQKAMSSVPNLIEIINSKQSMAHLHLHDLVKKMMEIDPNKRLKVEDAIYHPFFGLEFDLNKPMSATRSIKYSLVYNQFNTFSNLQHARLTYLLSVQKQEIDKKILLMAQSSNYCNQENFLNDLNTINIANCSTQNNEPKIIAENQNIQQFAKKDALSQKNLDMAQI